MSTEKTAISRKKRKTRRQETEDLKQKIADAEEKYLRLYAEFDNFRKRSQRDLEITQTRSKMLILESILPILDQFHMAMDATSQNSTDVKVLKQGMDMILAEFTNSFRNIDVKQIETIGQIFDPNIHEAVSTEASETVLEGYIIREWKAGYRLGDQLLRAASVVVSSGSSKKEDGKDISESQIAKE